MTATGAIPPSPLGATPFAYESRECENCGSSRQEELWAYSHDVKTRHRLFRFDVRNVICRDCGFVFVSPVPSAASLQGYYADAYSAPASQLPDYDVERRLACIDSAGPRRRLLVEVGSNQQTAFHQRLASEFQRVVTVELNEGVSADCRSLADVEPGSADVVAHYFVLEHVTAVGQFLGDCARVLAADGVMIVEVPDLAIYPADPVALGNFEHMNHFSRGMLDSLAALSGFAPIDVARNLCSRPFGMVAAYRKDANAGRHAMGGQGYDDNKRLFLAGFETLDRMRQALARSWTLVEKYQALGRAIVFWGANEMMDRFLGGRLPGPGVTVVDSDPLKAGFSREFAVHTPAAAADAVRQSSAIFLFTKLHSAAILADLRMRFGKTYAADAIHIVDYMSANA